MSQGGTANLPKGPCPNAGFVATVSLQREEVAVPHPEPEQPEEEGLLPKLGVGGGTSDPRKV